MMFDPMQEVLANGWPVLLGIDDPGYDADRHPFWVFDWGELAGLEVLICGVVLAFSGILCSAGGIGGGGIYVTVLMVTGKLSPKDAVPLSKSIVFFGSMSSLLLNMRKTVSANSSQGLIDYNICRLVVPAALVGTLMGVFLNSITADWILIALLSTVLLFMTCMTIRTGVNQYWAETKPSVDEGNFDAAIIKSDEVRATSEEATDRSSRYGSVSSSAVKKSIAFKLTPQDGFLSIGVLVFVIICGVFRFHAGACMAAVQTPFAGSTWQTCHHPSVRIVGDSLEGWMGIPLTGDRVLFFALALPITVCTLAMVYCGRICVVDESWPFADVLKYQLMAVSTGCLAGLVGIGGGLIFSPFFLVMGVNPAIAVATSSTCVIFTSSSTTMQYLLTDRIIMSLTVVYGAVNLLASYVGTSLVHRLQDSFAARKSFITGIVAVGVFISTVLAVIKMFDADKAVHAVHSH